MILIEFNPNFKSKQNLIKYKAINEIKYHFLYVDLETINLLLINYGIVSKFNSYNKTSILKFSGREDIDNVKIKHFGTEVNIKLINNHLYSNNLHP